MFLIGNRYLLLSLLLSLLLNYSEIQLLGLMYSHKRDPENLRIPVRNTREANREIFKTERYQNYKYKNSPYYKGSELWKTLPVDLAVSECLLQFKFGLKRLYKKYKGDD